MALADNRRDASLDVFTFPSTPIGRRDPEFEFGTGPAPDSPADYIFSNGKLLPHAFPIRSHTLSRDYSSHAVARASSAGWKDPLMSCRSSSTRSSARTSSSDVPEQRPLGQSRSASRVQNNPSARERNRGYAGQQSLYRTQSHRWQLIMPVTSLSYDASRRRKSQDGAGASPHGDKLDAERLTRPKQGFCGGFLRSFSSTCKRCHALEPPKKKERDGNGLLHWIS